MKELKGVLERYEVEMSDQGSELQGLFDDLALMHVTGLLIQCFDDPTDKVGLRTKLLLPLKRLDEYKVSRQSLHETLLGRTNLALKFQLAL